MSTRSVLDPLAVAVTALGAAVAMAASNAAYGLHLLSNPNERNSVMEIVSGGLMWVGMLNKTLMPAVAQLLRDSSVDEWTRYMNVGGAVLGMGGGAIGGLYTVLIAYGKAVTRSGDAFGWRALNVYKWICLGLGGVHILVGFWYIVAFRQVIALDVVGRVIGVTAGYLALAMLEFGVLAIAAYYCTLAGKEWVRNRGRKW